MAAEERASSKESAGELEPQEEEGDLHTERQYEETTRTHTQKQQAEH